MSSARRIAILLIIGIVTLSACAASSSVTSAPAATPTAPQPAVGPDPNDGVVLASGHYQLLMLYASTWTTCQELAPVVNGLMKKYTDRARFVRVNIHTPQSSALKEQLGFSASPELYLVDPTGHVLHYWGGDSIDLAQLEETIKALPPSSWDLIAAVLWYRFDNGCSNFPVLGHSLQIVPAA